MAHTWAKLADIDTNKLTPMLRQYLEAKAESGDSLLFFRMGDFYELFFEDALEAAEILGIALTSRDGAAKNERVPMAGVPVRAVEGYVAKVIKAGRTVTICDQIEDPRDAKGVVKRAVVKTVTPGTVTEPGLLDESANNYLAAVYAEGNRGGIALVDISTGEFLAAQLEGNLERALADELTRTAPAEILVPQSLDSIFAERLSRRFDGVRFTPRPEQDFDAACSRDLLLDQFVLKTLKGIELDDAPQALACAGAVLAYVKETQRDAVPHLRMPRRYAPSHFVVLDGNTQRNLELVESMRDRSRRGTLLNVLDRTRTSMGGRKIRDWVLHPLIDMTALLNRLDAVEELHDRAELRLRLCDAFTGIADIERLIARLSAKAGNARDMQQLGLSLVKAPELRALLADTQSPMLQSLYAAVDALEDVTQWIADAIVAEAPQTLTEGGIIRDGYNEELDRIRGLVRGGKDWIATLQREESEKTGIPNLKVGYNKVFGYYIEVSRSQTQFVPDTYERKQTLVNAERYVTPGLKSREEEIVTAQERMCRIEYDLFVELREKVTAQSRRIRETAEALATLDVLLSFAAVASSNRYTKPAINDGEMLRIREGRHPVVEDLMPRGEFVPNDTRLGDDATLVIVTGPNMAGKSTYLRQVALIVLMAQVGSFVPAAEAEIGIVDRIFTRVGASDNLVRGESTFMVEMIETATILNAASKRSLIVLDEIGRGTSTFDGISIAWSVAEHIHNGIGAKTLFATHYHELTELANQLERVRNVNVAIREWGGKVIFLYRIVDGGADHSYGIQVAKLAGLPPSVIGRAREILQALEAGNSSSVGLPQQMYLFGAAPELKPSPLEKEMELVDPDALSPREAHELVCHLKSLLEQKKPE